MHYFQVKLQSLKAEYEAVIVSTNCMFDDIIIDIILMLSKPISDLILIRHAQSKFNQGFLNYKKQHKLDLSWDECIQIDDFNKKVSYSQQFIDCEITEEGKKQCKKTREMLKDEQIDVVLVSPYFRALQTCNQIFGGRNIRVEVHPLLAEVFRYACDISNHMKQKEEIFKEFDFSPMNDKSQLWCIEHLSQKNKENFLKHLPKEREMNLKEKQEKILSLIAEKVLQQTPQDLRQRTWKVKELLKQYQQKYKRIAVVSHFYLIGTLIAKKFNEQGEVVQFQEIFNGIPVYKSIDQLSMVR